MFALFVWALAEMFSYFKFAQCVLKKYDFVGHNKLWNKLKYFLKRGKNFKCLTGVLETTVQQGYMQNWKGIGQLVMKPNTAENYLEESKISFVLR